MQQEKPRELVNHPWVVLLGLLGTCALAAQFSTRYTCGPFPTTFKGKVSADLLVLHTALEEYALNHGGDCPDSLQALITPDERGHRYLNHTRTPRDPWNREYVYLRGMGDTLVTYGRDGVPGGTGADADIDYASVANGR